MKKNYAAKRLKIMCPFLLDHNILDHNKLFQLKLKEEKLKLPCLKEKLFLKKKTRQKLKISARVIILYPAIVLVQTKNRG